MDNDLKQFVAQQRERFGNARVDKEIETVKLLVSKVRSDDPKTIKTPVRLSDKTLKKLTDHGLIVKSVYLPRPPSQPEFDVLYTFEFSSAPSTHGNNTISNPNKRWRRKLLLAGWSDDDDDEDEL